MNSRIQFGIIPALVALCVFFQIASIWFIDFIPFQDYYDWLYQSMVLNQLWAGDEFASTHFEIGEGSWHQPNALITLLLAALQFVFSAQVAGKILLTIITGIFIAGGYRIIQAFSPNNPLRFIPFLVSYHYFFYKGFLSFSLGMGLFLLAFSILKSLTKPAQKALFFLLISIVLFYTHGFIYGVFCFVGLMWMIFEKKPSRGFEFKQFLPLAGYFPSLILLIRYLGEDVSGHEQFLVPYHSLLHWAQVLRYGLSIIPRFTFTENLMPLSVINILFLILLFAILIAFCRKLRFSSAYGIIFLSLSAMMIFNPFYKMGVFEPLSSRLTIILVVMGCGLFAFQERKKNIEIGILTLSLLISIAHFAHLRISQLQFAGWIDQAERYRVENSRTLFFGKQAPTDFDRNPLVIFSGIDQPYLFLNSFFDVRDELTSLHYLQLTGVVVSKSVEAKTYFHLETNLIDVSGTEEMESFIQSNEEIFSDYYDSIVLLKSTGYTELFERSFEECFNVGKDSEKLLVFQNECGGK